MELYTGSLLFPTHDEVEHLAMIEKLCGPIPKHMILNCTEELENVFYYEKYNEEEINLRGK